MIEPNYNKLRLGDAVEVAVGDDMEWLPGVVTGLKKNHQGQTIWAEVAPDDGSEMVRVSVADMDCIRRGVSRTSERRD